LGGGGDPPKEPPPKKTTFKKNPRTLIHWEKRQEGPVPKDVPWWGRYAKKGGGAEEVAFLSMGGEP